MDPRVEIHSGSNTVQSGIGAVVRSCVRAFLGRLPGEVSRCWGPRPAVGTRDRSARLGLSSAPQVARSGVHGGVAVRISGEGAVWMERDPMALADERDQAGALADHLLDLAPPSAALPGLRPGNRRCP